MKKFILLIAIVSLFATMLTGCKNVTKTPNVTINVGTSFALTDVVGPNYYSLLQGFRAANRNINVSDHSVKADDAWKAHIRSQFESGQEPDVLFFYTASDIKEIIEEEQVVSLDTIREVYPNYCNNIKEEALESMREFDGKIYAVPVTGFWEGIYCNTELFERYDVPAITDWESLLKAIEIFKSNKIIPIAASFSDIPNYWIEHSILAAGGVDKHAANPKSAAEVPPEWEEGLTLLKQLYDIGAFQSDSLETRHDFAVNLYNNQEAAMILDGSWMQVDAEIKTTTNVVGFPTVSSVAKSQQGVIAGFSMGFYISKKAWDDPNKRDACVKFVQYMTNDQAIARICNAGAPASNISIPNGTSNIVRDGITICNTYKTELPIDSRLEKGAWEYFTSTIPYILKNEIEIATVLENVALRNALDGS